MDHYKLSNCEKVRSVEQKLKKEIAELKNEIDETELLYGKNVRPTSSISTPMSSIYFQKERKMNIKKALDVSGVKPLKNQGQVMIEELEAALATDISEQSLPLLLHQFFLDRMQSLVQCKHLHMLRWRRFCEHTDVIERMYPKYMRRINEIKAEYDDSKHRAQRLSAAYHSCIMEDKNAIKSLKAEDIAVFFRWLVVHLHSTKKLCTYLKLLEWLPTIHKNDIDLQLAAPIKSTSEADVFNQTTADVKSAWKNMTAGLDFSYLSASSTSLRSSSGTNTLSMNITSDLAFSGFVSNEVTLGIPCHVTELSNFRDQLESLTTEYGITIRSTLSTSADEMELFGAVNRHFKTLFNRQLDCVKFYQYDNTIEGYEHWGVDSASHCLKKPSNWIKHIRIKPRNNPSQLRQSTFLKQKGNIDELLRSQNRFLSVNDFARVTESLKEHAVAVRDPPTVLAITTTTHKGKTKTDSVWRRIYEDAEKHASSISSACSDVSKDSNNTDRHASSRFGSYGKKKESYDYANTMQMLGLDEGDDSANQDPTVIQGAYLSFLHLRHLKMRDLKRQSLAILNYFRSIERTITIYDGGLSQEAGPDSQDNKEGDSDTDTLHNKRSKSANHRSRPSATPKVNQAHGGKGHTLGIGSHQYVYNTPADYKIDQNQFMEFAGVENHDDFYTLDLDEHDHVGGARSHTGGDGGGDWKSAITAAAVSSGSLGADSTPHVQDHRGYFIMYDSAIADLEALDDELILMASQFLEKDTAVRAVMRRSQAERAQMRHDVPGEVDIASYGHRGVDRFAVLLDVWTCELNFLVNKRKLLDCYIEAYHSTFDPIERHNLAQIITDLIHQRPRYDFTQEYFIRTYRSECACLRLKAALLSQILTGHMEDCKHYLNKIARPVHITGMPLLSTARQEISVNLPNPALKHVDMMEFHPTLGVLASRVVEALGLAIHELQLIHRPASMSESIALEKQVLEHAQLEWEGLASAGLSFSPQVQKDIFSEDFAEDVYMMNDVVDSILNPSNPTDNDFTADEATSIKVWSSAVEAVLIRQRLIEAAWETEILARLYKQVATDMGFGEFHMYLRVLQFEFAAKKDRVDPSPSMLSNFVADDSNADRYVPATLLLAVSEMDENHLPKFAFSNREGVLQLLKKESCLANLRVVLACQVCHKNALTVAITQSNNCALWRDLKAPSAEHTKEGGVDTSESRSNVSISTTVTQGTIRSGVSQLSPGGKRPGRTQNYSGKLKFGFDKMKRSPEPFISIQLEKTGPRDVVVNAYVLKKETQGMKLRNEGETEKLKRSLVADFCREVSFRMSLHAMRAQIIAYYSSMVTTLEPFSHIRNNYFMIGKAGEKKRKTDEVSAMIPDPKSFQKRPKRVISPDGKCFMNLWYIPHFTEVISSYRSMDYESQDSILRIWLNIASSLHDIVLHLCARARLGSASTLHKLGQTGYAVAADWGGAEGIGAQLSEIQDQINTFDPGAAPYTQDPAKVAEFLELKKEIFFLEFDSAVRHSMRETFLAMNNMPAYQSITDNMQFGLPPLSNIWETAITCLQMRVPIPLDPGSAESVQLYPWLSFMATHGRHPTSYPELWSDPESCMQLCLGGLHDLERQLANGELLGVSLLLQEVLNNGTIAYQALEGNSEELPRGFLQLNQVAKSGQKNEDSPENGGKRVIIKRKSVDVFPNAARKELNKRKGPKINPDLPLDKIAYPIDALRLMKTFLRLWKQLDLFKIEWAKEKLQLKCIDTPAHYKEMNHAFRAEIMVPVYTTMARQMGNVDAYDEIASDELPLPPPPGAPELAVRARLLIKLLEVYEVKMVTETRQRISKEYTLALAERAREETALPADLWSNNQTNSGSSTSSMRENFTVSRPYFVDDFMRRLISDSNTENGSITFKKEHLNNCLSQLSTDVMQRERENYESYTLYYENLLRHHQHLLYVKELELKALETKQGSSGDGESAVEAQFQLADRSHELILEITSLRAKVTEMREQSMTMDQDIRDDVRRDYQELVQNLFEACFQMKSRLALCHLSIHDDVRNLISETRAEAMKALGKLKNESPTSTAEERLRTIHVKEEQVKKLQDEQCELNKLITKLHALHHWKRSTTGGRYKVTVEKLSQDVNKTRRDCLSKSLVAKEEAELRFEELMSARRSLQGSDAKLKKTYEQMEREKRIQKEKEYKELQAQRNRRQLALAKQRDMERLVVELQEKDKRLRNLTADVERNSRMEQTHQTKIQRNLKQISTQLSIERTLKLDAFDRVDSLQAQVMETEKDTGVLAISRPTSATLSIPKSAITQRSRTQSTFITSPTPSTPKVRVRPMSCIPTLQSVNEVQLPKKRPQTAAGRLKNKIAAAILTEIYPATDEHETVIQLDRLPH